jgi:uncharacterized membrane protein YdbT with pleckstrin-like domain
MGYVQQMLGEHEKVVFVTHQHWMTLARSAIENLGLALLITLVVVAAQWVRHNFFPAFNELLGYLLLLLWAIPVARFVYHFLQWDNREYIITNRRVIQIDGIYNKNVTDSSLEKVNDVKLRQSILGRTLGYGDLEILTASELGTNLFRHLADPIRFKTAMLNQKEAMGMGEGIAPPQAQPLPPVIPPVPDVPTLIGQLDQLRRQGIISEEEFQRKKQELLERI